MALVRCWFGPQLALREGMQVLIPPTTANVIAATAPAPQGGPNVAFHAFLSEAAGTGAEDGGLQSDRAESRDRADKKRVNTDSSGAGLTAAAPALLAVAVPPMVQQQHDVVSEIPEDATDSGALAAMPGIVNNAAGSDAGATQAMPAVAGQVVGAAADTGMAAADLTPYLESGVLPAAVAADSSSATSKQTGVMAPTTGTDIAGAEVTAADPGAALPNASMPQKSVVDAGSFPSVHERGFDMASRGPSRTQAKTATTGTSAAGDKPGAAMGADLQNAQIQKNVALPTEKQVVILPPAMPLMTIPVSQTTTTNVDVPASGQGMTGAEGSAGFAGLNATGKKAAGANKGNAGPAMSLTGISPEDQGAATSQTAHGVMPAVRPVTVGDAGAADHRDATQAAAAMTAPANAANGNGGETAVAIVPDSPAAALAAVRDASEAIHAPAINSARLIQKMNESEMRVGMQTAEFGSISVRTSMVHEQLAAQISVDYAELGRAMSQHLSSMQARLGEEYGLHARIEIRDGGTSYTSDADRGSSGGQQESNPRGGFQRFQTGAVMTTRSSVAPLSSIASARLDIRI